MQNEIYTVLPRNQREAYKAGSKFFFNGKPCIRHHISVRYESSGACLECTKLVDAGTWSKKNPEKYKAYLEKNASKIKKARLARHNNRMQSDPVYAMKTRIRNLLRVSLTNRGYEKRAKTNQILGCGWLEFIRHLELQFDRAMSWENMHLWEVDHIVPLATAKTEADVIALNHFTNLRPLWSQKNRSKGAKITHLI